MSPEGVIYSAQAIFATVYERSNAVMLHTICFLPIS